MQPVKVYGASAAPSGGSVLSGIIAGVLLAVVWMLLVWFTHNPVSLAGWGVGGLIGLAVARGARGTNRASGTRGANPSLGTVAVVLTIGTVVLGKALILAFALRPIVRDEIVRNRWATTGLFLIDMTAHRSFSPDLQAALDQEARELRDSGHSPLRAERALELQERIAAEARARDSAASPAQREQLVRMYSDSILARQGFLPMLGRLFSIWDLLWLGLGVSSAWKLAQSRFA